MSQQVGDLSRRQRPDRAVGLADAVHQRCREGVPDRVQPLLLDACRVEDTVVAASEVHGAGIAAVLVGDQGCVLAEVSLRSEVEDCVDGCLVQRHVALAGRALELADPDLAPASGLSAVAPGNLLHAALDVYHSAVEVDVVVEEPEGFARPQPGVEHQRVGCRLLVDALAVAPGAGCFRFEPLDFLRRECRHRFAGRAVFLALRREKVRLLDHRRRRHGILGDQFLLRQVAEVVGE